MADLKRYQVISACALIPVTEPGGTTVIRTLYRGHVFDADPADLKVAHNAESGYIAEIGAKAVAGVDNSGTPLVDDKPTVGGGNPGDPVALNDPGVVNDEAHQVAAKREAAKAKLPADGTAPHGNATHETWVEYAVVKGYDRTVVESSSRDEIKALFKA